MDDSKQGNRELPADFAQLGKFVNWALPTQGERRVKRLTSTMPEIEEFYAAILPEMERIATYLDQYPMHEMPDDAKLLLYLTYAFMAVAPAVEIFNEPSVTDAAFDYRRFVEVGE
ncbi:MAG: hypothetical protein IVW54_02745 [Candidatus Binataceae bacterium]|nr:hypothetical protein [Candidatus Binataceae bacterium]